MIELSFIVRFTQDNQNERERLAMVSASIVIVLSICDTSACLVWFMFNPISAGLFWLSMTGEGGKGGSHPPALEAMLRLS